MKREPEFSHWWGQWNPVLFIERKPEDEAPIDQYSLEQEGLLIEQLQPGEIDMLRLAILTGMR